MALNVNLQLLSQPGATGNQTISLPANFDPKAVICWAVPGTASGSVANMMHSYGAATYRGSTVAQRCVSLKGIDNSAAADNAIGLLNDALCCIYTATAASATRDLEIDLVSMQGGATSQVVINWVNLHTTGVRVILMILGGSDISDALVGELATGTASTIKDQTVAAGFGKPELTFFFGAEDLVGALGDYSTISPCFSHGFAKQGEAGRMTAFAQTDGNTSSLVAAQQRTDRCIGFLQNGGGGQIMLGRLDTVVGNWPTDGFRMLFDANPALNTVVFYLALRTTAQIATGDNAAPTAGGTPVAQDNACGFVPKVGYLFNWSRIASAAVATADATAADLVGMGIGVTDGTSNMWAGFTEDDGLGTMDSNSQNTGSKVVQFYNAAASLEAQADGVFSGNNFRLSFTTIHTRAASYQWLALGDAVASNLVVQAVPASLTVDAVASAQEVATASALISASASASVQETASASASVQVSALANAQEQATGRATVTISALATLAIPLVIDVPPSTITLSSLATAALSSSSSGQINLAASASVQETLSAKGTITVSASGAVQEVASAGASTTLSALASAASVATSPSSRISMSALASAAMSASGGGTVSVGASARVSDEMTTLPGTITMSAQAVLPGVPISIVSPAASMTLSAAVSAVLTFTSPAARITLSSSASVSSIASASALISMSSAAKVSSELRGVATISLSALARAEYDVRAVPASFTLSGAVSVTSELRSPAASVLLSASGRAELSAQTTPGTITFSALASISAGFVAFTGQRPSLESAARTGPSSGGVAKVEPAVTIGHGIVPELQTVTKVEP